MLVRWRGATSLALLLVALLVAPGCRDSEKPDEAPGSTEVQLDTPDGRTSGFVYGAMSTRGIVLVADDANTRDWSALAGELGRIGYQVLVLPRPARDGGAAARAAADQLTRQGVQQVVFVGSGSGATAALEAAAGGARGVGILNPDGNDPVIPAGGLPPVALLAMASLGDGASSAAAQEIYGAAREPRTLALYPSSETVPAAFAGESNELKTAFLDFLRLAFQPLAA
ncbi:MAG: hypothetical protein AB7R89_22195 [Dehalococcoidia bacterium]